MVRTVYSLPVLVSETRMHLFPNLAVTHLLPSRPTPSFFGSWIDRILNQSLPEHTSQEHRFVVSRMVE